jgi:hypothetical protein
MEDAITPAQMAQARYNAIMEQTNTINGKAAETQDDAARAMQKFHESMEDAMASVGEALLPVATGIANFIASIPPPLLQAGTWIALGGGIAAGLGGAVIAISALRRAIADLGTASAVSAAQVSAAKTASTGTGSGLGGAAGKAGALAVALPIITATVSELIKGITNKDDYNENAFTRALNTITNDKGEPGWLFGGEAKTAYMKDQAMTLKMEEAQFRSWMADAELLGKGQTTNATMDYFKEMGEHGFTKALDLPGGGIDVQSYTYQQVKELWLEGGKSQDPRTINIIIGDRTDNGITADEASWAESNY